MEPTEEAPLVSRARVAGVFYLLTFLTGGFALVDRSRLGVAAGLIAGACFVGVTWLFYGMFKPVSKSRSLLAFGVKASARQAQAGAGGVSLQTGVSPTQP